MDAVTNASCKEQTLETINQSANSSYSSNSAMVDLLSSHLSAYQAAANTSSLVSASTTSDTSTDSATSSSSSLTSSEETTLADGFIILTSILTTLTEYYGDPTGNYDNLKEALEKGGYSSVSEFMFSLNDLVDKSGDSTLETAFDDIFSNKLITALCSAGEPGTQSFSKFMLEMDNYGALGIYNEYLSSLQTDINAYANAIF